MKKSLLLYSLVGLSLSSISFIAQAKIHRSPQITINPEFKHYSDYIDIATEDIQDYINGEYNTNPISGVPQYLFNHVGTESGDNGNTNHEGAKGRYNEMFDAELEYSNALKRDTTIGDKVMSKYRDSHDMLWLKVRHMERYNAERERLYSQHRGEEGWKAMSDGSGIPKTVHLDVYGARVGNYRAEQLAKFRLTHTGTDKNPVGPSGPVGTTSPHQDDYARMGGAINLDHMNTLQWGGENFVSPTWSFYDLLKNGNAKEVQTQTPKDEQAHGKTADILALEKYMFNDGEVDGSHDIEWGRDAYSSYMYERVELGKYTGSDGKTHIDMASTVPSKHLAGGLPSAYLPDGSSNPDWHPIGHFVGIMSDENINAPGSVVTDINYASVDEFGFKRTNFVPPMGLKTINGKDYYEVIIKSTDPTLAFMSHDTMQVDHKNVAVYDEKGNIVYNTGDNTVSAENLYDKQKQEYRFYVPVDSSKNTAFMNIFIYPAIGGGGFGFSGDRNFKGADQNEAPDYPDGGLAVGSTGEKKTGDNFQDPKIRSLFLTPGDIQNALLAGPFQQKQAIANYQTIEVDGFGKVALDDPKTVIEYGYGTPINQESLSANNVAYLSNRGIVMATNGAKGVKLNDTDIFVNEGVLYADDQSVAIEMNNHDNIIQLRNDLIEGKIDGGEGQDTLLLSKPKHQMDEVGSDKSAQDTDKYVVNNITLANIEQIHAQSGDWYFKSNINMGKSTLSGATVLPWIKYNALPNNAPSGLTDTYDSLPQQGNLTLLGKVTVDYTSKNPLIYANNLTLKGNLYLNNVPSNINGKIPLEKLFNVKSNLLVDGNHIHVVGVNGVGFKNKDAKIVVGQFDRPITGSVLLGSSENLDMVNHGTTLINENLITQLTAHDKQNIGNDKVGFIADNYKPLIVDEDSEATGDGSVGVWAGLHGKDITIEKSIIANGPHSKAIELNRKNNTLTLQANVKGMIDAGSGNDTLILSATSNTPSTDHTINGDVIGINNIQTTNGTWTFTKAIELSADNTQTDDTSTDDTSDDTSPASPPPPPPTLPSSHPYSAPQNTPPVAPSLPYYVSPLGTLLPYAHAGSANPMTAQVVSNHLIFSGKLTFDVDPVNKISSYIKADHVELKQGYAVKVTSLVADPGVTYTATLIESSDIINDDNDEKKNGYSYNDGLWKVNTYYDDNGLYAYVKASNTVDYKTNALDYNDDVTFGISNQVAKYRTNSVVAHDSKYLDFSVSGNTSGDYQNLSLLSTHLNVSTPFAHELPFLKNNDNRDLVNIQAGYYHGSGTQADFNRSVNAYTMGGSMKIYNPFHQKKKALLTNLWLSTGFDFGLSQQFNIARHNEHFDQYATKGKENDLFATNTILSGLDLYGHLQNKSNIKISITPYMGVGFNLARLGEYTETAINPLTIQSQYRLNMYSIFGLHVNTNYKLKNNQQIGVGANIETNVRFNNKGKNITYSYANYNSGTPKDNAYKRLPFTVSLDANYQPKDYISIFTKLSGSTQEIYNYNISLGAKIKF